VTAELAELGFPMVAISPDRPEKLVESRKAKELDYTLYSDSKMEAARAFGIAFQVDDTTREQYKQFDIDLDEASGEGHGQLPIPSVFLVAPGGVIHWAYWNPDYKVRPKNETLLLAARTIGAKLKRADPPQPTP
jgi:peroxiredoxin